jgi:hypothetical protein
MDYFIFKYFLTSKIAVLYKKMSNGSPLLNRILFFPKNKLFSVMSNCSTNCAINTIHAVYGSNHVVVSASQ